MKFCIVFHSNDKILFVLHKLIQSFNFEIGPVFDKNVAFVCERFSNRTIVSKPNRFDDVHRQFQFGRVRHLKFHPRTFSMISCPWETRLSKGHDGRIHNTERLWKFKGLTNFSIAFGNVQGKEALHDFIRNVLGFISNRRVIDLGKSIRSSPSASCRKLFYSFAATMTKKLMSV